MALARSQYAGSLSFLSAVKSILIWSFVLAVCMIVVGFPILVLVVSLAALMAFTLQAIMPLTAILYTVAAFIGVHLLGIFAVSTFLTLRGVRPQDVDWMTWLRDQENPVDTAVYAACPLTCDIKSSVA
ncbi:hypothetical protein IQ266_17710 [filamentous cyanobacterium LEGE 11480]|uniref:Oleosin n=1 Tax=Romeriopsis navalis LEGE 11480 TaxID=2777977 RepID=A0A928VPW1_9CYAN|nr:hypothetical protein [Romeriopsis navalis]MBE9031572.1 hypothetical protein [Romeriopsis navalis LEGE 11480]